MWKTGVLKNLLIQLLFVAYIQLRKPIMTFVRESLAMQADEPPRRRDRQKKMWMEVVEIDVKKYNLHEDLTKKISE